MKQGLVSILVVSYNAEKYIEKTLKSCLNQTYGDLEVLLLDNDSKDNTVEIAEGLRQIDFRLKIFKSEKNVGPYTGLNFLLDEANGEYVAIQDHDDVWFPEKLMKQIEFLKNNNDYIACGTNTFYFYEKQGILILNKKPEVVDFVDHTSLFFRNNGFRYDPLNALPDLHFEKRILLKSGRILCLRRPLVVHRIRDDANNFSRSRFKFNYRNLVGYFSLNTNILDLINFLFIRHLPEWIVWFIRKNVTLRKATWIHKEDFFLKYPEVQI